MKIKFKKLNKSTLQLELVSLNYAKKYNLFVKCLIYTLISILNQQCLLWINFYLQRLFQVKIATWHPSILFHWFWVNFCKLPRNKIETKYWSWKCYHIKARFKYRWLQNCSSTGHLGWRTMELQFQTSNNTKKLYNQYLLHSKRFCRILD